MACLDGVVESTYVVAKIVTDMLEDTETEIACVLKGSYNFRSTLLDSYTKMLAWQLIKQLWENWWIRELDIALAKASVQVS